MQVISGSTNGVHVKTRTGETFIRTLGEGKPLIIIHGGPGLEHTYLINWLQPLAQNRLLIFYDQLGCGNDKTPIGEISAKSTVDQLAALIEELQISDTTGLLCHSWGAYVAMSLVQRYSWIKPREIIFSNPTALTSERHAASGKRFLARIPQDVMNQISEIMSSGDIDAGKHLMEKALPYYVAFPSKTPKIDFASYHQDVYGAVSKSLGDFDFRSLDISTEQKLLFIFGEKDYMFPSDTAEIQSPHSKIKILEGVGHMSFAENQTEFLNAINSIFN
jgi:proline iminopeptidase